MIGLAISNKSLSQSFMWRGSIFHFSKITEVRVTLIVRLESQWQTLKKAIIFLNNIAILNKLRYGRGAETGFFKKTRFRKINFGPTDCYRCRLIKPKRIMAVVRKSESIEEENNRSLKTLARAIELSRGEFSLIIVCCPCREKREEIKRKLKELYSVKPEELTLAKTATTLLSTILTKLEKKQPEALFISGLESVENLKELLTASNIVRNQFREKLHFPLILWVAEEVQQKLMRLAPDFYSWAAVTIKFRTKRSLLSNGEEKKLVG